MSNAFKGEENWQRDGCLYLAKWDELIGETPLSRNLSFINFQYHTADLSGKLTSENKRA